MKNPELFFGYHFPMDLYWENYRNRGFTQLSLDFSSRCNYDCDHCFNKQFLNQTEPDILTLKERTKLIEDSVRLGVKTLVIPGTGEPTLDPYFKETIEAAYSLGLITVVYSNMTGRVNRSLIEFMFNHNVSVGIKMDTLRERYFRIRYHATKNDWVKYNENIPILFDVYKDSKSVNLLDGGVAYRLVNNMVLTKENFSEIEKISEFSFANGIPLFVRPVKSVGMEQNNPTLWKKIGNRFGLGMPENELIMLAKKYNTLFSPSSTIENHCAIFSFGLTVKSNGDIQLCPDHHTSRGMFNVRTTKLQEIITKVNIQRKVESGYCVMFDK